jgi:hypothetical protein
MIKIYETANNFEIQQLGWEDNYFEKENAYIHMYNDSVLIIDLENALKTGKNCTEYRITAVNWNQNFRCDILNFLSCNDISLSNFIEMLKGDSLPESFGETLEVRKSEVKGVRVFSPFAKIKNIKTPKKWNTGNIVKAILTGQIVNAKKDMYLTDDYAGDATNNFGKGEIIALELAKNICESPSGWWISVDSENEKEITLSVNCHHFDYNTLVFSK